MGTGQGIEVFAREMKFYIVPVGGALVVSATAVVNADFAFSNSCMQFVLHPIMQKFVARYSKQQGCSQSLLQKCDKEYDVTFHA